jgi:hypothetical protein
MSRHTRFTLNLYPSVHGTTWAISQETHTAARKDVRSIVTGRVPYQRPQPGPVDILWILAHVQVELEHRFGAPVAPTGEARPGAPGGGGGRSPRHLHVVQERPVSQGGEGLDTPLPGL